MLHVSPYIIHYEVLYTRYILTHYVIRVTRYTRCYLSFLLRGGIVYVSAALQCLRFFGVYTLFQMACENKLQHTLSSQCSYTSYATIFLVVSCAPMFLYYAFASTISSSVYLSLTASRLLCSFIFCPLLLRLKSDIFLLIDKIGTSDCNSWFRLILNILNLVESLHQKLLTFFFQSSCYLLYDDSSRAKYFTAGHQEPSFPSLLQQLAVVASMTRPQIDPT